MEGKINLAISSEILHEYEEILNSFFESDTIGANVTNLIALKKEDTEGFLKILTSFLAGIPGRLHLPKEAYYHSLFYLLMRLVGIEMLLERETDKGRIDGVIEFTDKVYIIEFKFATNKRVKRVKTLSSQAIRQIHQQKYYEPFLGSGKKIILFGIGFLDKQLDGKIEVVK